MGSFKPDAFDPLDLELIESVYNVAWKTIVARDLYRDTSRDAERQASLRRLIFIFARQGPVVFDTLYEKALGVCMRLGCRLRRRNEAVRRREAFPRSDDLGTSSVLAATTTSTRASRIFLAQKGRPPKRATSLRPTTASGG